MLLRLPVCIFFTLAYSQQELGQIQKYLAKINQTDVSCSCFSELSLLNVVVEMSQAALADRWIHTCKYHRENG